jgi:hypothetical protein
MQHTGGDLPEKKNKVKDDTQHDTLGYTDIVIYYCAWGTPSALQDIILGQIIFNFFPQLQDITHKDIY